MTRSHYLFLNKKKEIILALVVVTAVIFFGALISLGNERQRKAIDGLRTDCFMGYTRPGMKYERLARDIRVDDPTNWLNMVVTDVIGTDLNAQFVEAFDQPT